MDLSAQFNQQLIDQLDSYISVLDVDSKFMQLNCLQAHVMGYSHTDKVYGLGYEYFRGPARARAELFYQADQQSMRTGQKNQYLSYDCFSDDQWLLLLCEKTPLCNEQGEVVGIYSSAKNMAPLQLIDLSQFLIQSQQRVVGKMKQQYFTFHLNNNNTQYPLSKRECEVLFYILRGKTAKEIAAIFCRTLGSVNGHLEHLKDKFSVHSRSQLVEKAIMEGYMNYLPDTLLR
jgi:DNA-binding CsgD family transcriptional regulator